MGGSWVKGTGGLPLTLPDFRSRCRTSELLGDYPAALAAILAEGWSFMGGSVSPEVSKESVEFAVIGGRRGRRMAFRVILVTELGLSGKGYRKT